METLVLALPFGFAAVFLALVPAIQPLPNWWRRGVAVSKYLIAVFLATFGSAAVGVLIAVPLLLHARLTHTDAGNKLFSLLLDRPYFPLQMVVAFFGGLVLAKWLREGKPAFVWVLPFAHLLYAIILFSSHRSVAEGSADFIWRSFFNWNCDCSASLLQWRITFPMCTSVAFSVAAILRKTLTI